jgi:hypothetical protein
MGVLGGLPLMISFLLIMTAAFRSIGRAMREINSASPRPSFLIWTLGATLFGLLMTFWSISLFDESAFFLYLLLAMIGAVAPNVAAASTVGMTVGLAHTQLANRTVAPPAAALSDGVVLRPRPARRFVLRLRPDPPRERRWRYPVRHRHRG